MRLNEIKDKVGSRKVRVRIGRGIGSGVGKTGGRGGKGQTARSGVAIGGFEGGQMPLQRRLPKVGFNSRVGKTRAELRLHELAIPTADVIDIEVLKKFRLVPAQTSKVKVILSGEITKAVKLKGIAVTKGARAAIEKAGGSIEE